MRKFIVNSEGIDIPLLSRSFDESHGITLCCVILNEEKNIKDFLNYYRPYVDYIAIIDGGSTDRTVELATSLVDVIQIRKFDGHYSNQANRVVEMSLTDWILLMDCDERLEKGILENLKSLIEQEEVDCWTFPRKNYIDGEFDPEHYPDWQDRLYRAYCRRVRPVHGEVVGFKVKKQLPCVDGNFIIHSKDSTVHNRRNAQYLFYEHKFRHEMGTLGAQTKENFEREFPKVTEHNFKMK